MIRQLLRLAALCAVLGVVVGVAWLFVAPTPVLVAGRPGDGLYYRSQLPGEFVAMDGWFAALCAVAGLVVAVVVLRRGSIGVSTVVAVAVTGVLGSLLAWGVGYLLGPDDPKQSPSMVEGAVRHGQLTLEARGVLLVWSIAALAVLLFALAWQGPESEPVTAPSGAGDSADSVGGDLQLPDLDGGK